MTIKKGDRVKFLNDVGGGIVTRIDNKTVYVENEDGFEVPTFISQLLKVEVPRAESSPFTRTMKEQNQRNISAETITHTKDSDETLLQPIPETSLDYIDLTDEPDEVNTDVTVNILLAWVPVRKKNPRNQFGTEKTCYDLYLVNDCGYNIMYVAAMVKDATYCGIQAGMLESDTTIHLTQISDDTLKTIKNIHFDILFFKKGNYLPQEPMHYNLKIDEFYLTDPVNYVSTLYFDEKALIYNISEEYLMSEIERVAKGAINKFENEKKQIDATPILPIKKKVPENDLEEIDLHIEQLVDNAKRLTPAEILEIQMDLFNKTLNEAIKNRKKKRIVFIHGVGNGRLRLEIQRTLSQKYPKLKFQDASFKEYGFGATMIMISG